MTHKQRCKHGCREKSGPTGCDLPPCLHSEADQFGPICLSCGRIKWPRIEVVVIVGAILFFAAHLAYWASVGFSVVK